MLAQRQLEQLRSIVSDRLAEVCRLAAQALGELQSARRLILDGRTFFMLKHIFDATEAIFRAVMLLLILLMGLEVVVFGAFISGLVLFRMGQLLWVLVFRERWI